MRLLVTILLLTSLACAEAPPLELEKSISLAGVKGRIDHMALDSKGEHLFVAALGNGSVEVVDLEQGNRTGTIARLARSEPQGAAAVGDPAVLVVAWGGDGLIDFYSDDRKLQNRIGHIDDADNMRVDAATGIVYVGWGDGALAVVDLKKREKTADIALDGHPEAFQLEVKGDRIFVNVPAKKQVEVVDRKKGKVVATWPLENAASNFPMALDEAGGRLYVGCRKPAKVLVLDTASGKQVAAFDAPGDADDIFWDDASKRLFVSGGDGTVAVFTKGEGDKFEAAPPTKTGAGARTSLLSPDGKHLFVAVPERDGQKAEIRVYSVKAAGK